MKSKIASLFLVVLAGCNNRVSTVESETHDEECPETEMDCAECGECSKPVSIAKCAVTYPTCEPSLPHEQFWTHGSHDCNGQYPPKLCEYVGDVTCEGVTAGVWCCK